MQRSQAYLESSLNFRVENDTAYCKNKDCNFHTISFFEAEDHWYKTHYIW